MFFRDSTLEVSNPMRETNTVIEMGGNRHYQIEYPTYIETLRNEMKEEMVSLLRSQKQEMESLLEAQRNELIHEFKQILLSKE